MHKRVCDPQITVTSDLELSNTSTEQRRLPHCFYTDGVSNIVGFTELDTYEDSVCTWHLLKQLITKIHISRTFSSY